METYWIALIATAILVSASSSQENLTSENNKVKAETTPSGVLSPVKKHESRRKLNHLDEHQAKEHNDKNKSGYIRREEHAKMRQSKLQDIISRRHNNKHGPKAQHVDIYRKNTQKDLINHDENAKTSAGDLLLKTSVASQATDATEIIDENITSKSITDASNELLIQDVNGYIEQQSVQENVDGILDSFSIPNQKVPLEKQNNGRRSTDEISTGNTGADDISSLVDDMILSSLKSVIKFENIEGIISNLLKDRSGRKNTVETVNECTIIGILKHTLIWLKSIVELKVLALRGIDYNEFETVETFDGVTNQLKACIGEDAYIFGLINIGGRVGMFLDRLVNRLLVIAHRSFIEGRPKRSILQDTELFTETPTFNTDFINNFGSLLFPRNKRGIFDVLQNLSTESWVEIGKKIGINTLSMVVNITKIVQKYIAEF